MQHVFLKHAELVYNGQWYTPFTETLHAFVDKAKENVNGDVKLKLYKGNIVRAGVTSPDTFIMIYRRNFDEDDDYDQYDAKGFITLYGLPIKVKAQQDQRIRNKEIKIMVLWEARFSKELNHEFNEFNSSLSFDS